MKLEEIKHTNVSLDSEIILEIQALSDEDDPNFFENQVKMFFQRFEELYPLMTASFDKKDFSLLQISAHSLAGSAGLVGATKLAALAIGIEELFVGQKFSETPEYLQAIDQEFLHIKPILLEIVGNSVRKKAS